MSKLDDTTNVAQLPPHQANGGWKIVRHANSSGSKAAQRLHWRALPGVGSGDQSAHGREQINHAAMWDACPRMVSTRLRGYLMLFAPLSRLFPGRPVSDHYIVLCLKAGLAGEDGPWGLNGELGNARFSRLAQSRGITDRPTTAR